MITYDWTCDDCEITFEEKQDPKKFRRRRKCPSCGQNTLYQDFSGGLSFHVMLHDTELKTIGHLAKRNREKFSSDYKGHLDRKHTEYLQEADKEFEKKELPTGYSRMEKKPGVKFSEPVKKKRQPRNKSKSG